jgi:hypothetical protein
MATMPVNRKLTIKIKIESTQSQLYIRLDILNFDESEGTKVEYYWLLVKKLFIIKIYLYILYLFIYLAVNFFLTHSKFNYIKSEFDLVKSFS